MIRASSMSTNPKIISRNNVTMISTALSFQISFSTSSNGGEILARRVLRCVKFKLRVRVHFNTSPVVDKKNAVARVGDSGLSRCYRFLEHGVLVHQAREARKVSNWPRN